MVGEELHASTTNLVKRKRHSGKCSTPTPPPPPPLPPNRRDFQKHRRLLRANDLDACVQYAFTYLPHLSECRLETRPRTAVVQTPTDVDKVRLSNRRHHALLRPLPATIRSYTVEASSSWWILLGRRQKQGEKDGR